MKHFQPLESFLRRGNLCLILFFFSVHLCECLIIAFSFLPGSCIDIGPVYDTPVVQVLLCCPLCLPFAPGSWCYVPVWSGLPGAGDRPHRYALALLLCLSGVCSLCLISSTITQLPHTVHRELIPKERSTLALPL